MNIDATCRGNVARMINHSCDGGNLMPVVVRRRGFLSPRVGLFAQRYITRGEELTFWYGTSADGGVGRRRCLCGTRECRGYLPVL